MARLAILLSDGDPGVEQILLARTLDFFGVPWRIVSVSGFSKFDVNGQDEAVFGSVASIAAVLQQEGMIGRCREQSVVFYAYSESDRSKAKRGITQLLESSSAVLRDAPGGIVSLEVSSSPAIKTGPMAGIRADLTMRKEDAIVTGLGALAAKVDPIISVDSALIYFRFQRSGVFIYICASSYMIDIDQEIKAGYYDIKDHFCSAAPLLIFIRSIFAETAWHPQELGACLIIDDPLLRRRYGCCDFKKLRKLMEENKFSINVAFIPWNWWRTSAAASDLFGNGSGPFSVSIHGCDHVEAEFGESSQSILYSRARLAQTRMRRHESRTGIHHEPVMVFPQGVFSSESPCVLKRSGYWAAVNTEISPVTGGETATRIRDAWDVAIMKFGDFAIFTRRYAHHGIENFSFDLLLGKPCLIVAHHEFFRDDNTAIIRLLEGIKSRNCSLKWQTLGAVVRKACRRREIAPGTEEIQMYGTELSAINSGGQALRAFVRRRESDPNTVAGVRCDEAIVEWHSVNGDLTFDTTIAPRSESRFHVSYCEPEQTVDSASTGPSRSSVATRRFLSEARDASVAHLASLDRIVKGLKRSRMILNHKATN